MEQHQWNISVLAGSIEIHSHSMEEKIKAVPMTGTTARILLFLQSTRHCSEAPPSSLK
jgi:hypothetical protein